MSDFDYNDFMPDGPGRHLRSYETYQGTNKMTQIKITAVSILPATTSKGDAYEQLLINYTDLSFNNTAKTKKIMPFGTSKAVHTALRNATHGQVFDVSTNKNAQGYIDWLDAKPGVEGAPVASAPASAPAASGGYTPKPAAQASVSPVRTSTYETPEERAKKQVYIIRQSSSSTAVAALSVGAKAPLKVADVVAFARELEAYVFDTNVTKDQPDMTGFDDMNDDVPL